MRKLNSKAVVTVGALFLHHIAMSSYAADWTITQSSNLSTSTTSFEATQSNSTLNTQALNGINLENNTDTINNSLQKVVFSGNDVALSQSGLNLDSSVQALNFSSAYNIIDLSQSVTGFGAATLTQEMSSGTGNIQALNYAYATSNIKNINQTVSGNSIALVSDTALSGNSQVINYLSAATYTGEVQQSVTLDSLDYTNSSTISRDLGINSIVGDISGSEVTQTVTIKGVITVDADNIRGSDPAIIINYVAP